MITQILYIYYHFDIDLTFKVHKRRQMHFLHYTKKHNQYIKNTKINAIFK